MSDDLDVYVPLSTYLDQTFWPTDLFGSLQGTFLDDIAYEAGDWDTDDDAETRTGYLLLRVVNEVVLDLPFGLALVFGGGAFTVTFDENSGGFVIGVVGDLVSLRLPRAIFIPAIKQSDGSFIPDTDTNNFVSVHVPIGITVDDKGHVVLGISNDNAEESFSEFDTDPDNDPDSVVDDDNSSAPDFAPRLDPTRFFIANTGISVDIEDIVFHLSDDGPLPSEAFAAGLDDTFRGVFIGTAGIFFPPDLATALPDSIVIENAFIGTGGFSGTVSVKKAFTGTLGGAQFTFQELDIVFVQNALTQFELKGLLKLPFIDNPVAVVVGLDLDGRISVQLSEKGGLITLQKPGVFKVEIDTIELDLQNSVLTAHAAGSLTPLFQPSSGTLKWPSIKIDDLSLDTQGHLHISGGWVDVPKQVTLSLFGFTLEITKVGFGETDDNKNWIGFSGALKLTEGISAGASVDGLRILWDDTGGVDLTMNGVGIDLVIPGALELHGKVSLTGPEFKGAVLVTIPSVSMTIQGQFVAGSLPTGEKTFAVFLDLELPVGIPLGPTGLALYGFAGLYAHNREPDKHDDEGWYRNPDFSDGWFTRPQEGVTDITNKWRGAVGKMGLGAGITFGTFSDNGYTFNGRVLLVLVFPGPVVLLDGMANLFRKRASLLSSEPEFHALMVIDPGKSIELGLDAHYKFKDAGELMDIRGSADAFFDFTNASNWHIYLGIKDPAERRIRARIFKLFDVNGFFMLDAHKLDLGAGWSYSKTWGFKHLNVSLSASMFGEAIVSWHPAHFTGSVGVSGSAGLHAFGIGIGVSVSATITGDVFEPFALAGNFHVGIDLPWPLPDVGATINLSWKQDLSSPPPLPVPLREASIEHPKSSNTWPLERGHSLRSDDRGGQFDFERPGNIPPVTPDDQTPPFGADVAAPRVPADTKVGLTFTRPMDDPSLIGTPNSAQVAAEIIGNPSTGKGAYTVGYAVQSVTLQKWAPTAESGPAGFAWVTIQSAGPNNKGTSPDRLLGAWQPGTEDPAQGNSQQNKLLINATTPFDYTADRAQAWVTWFTGANPGYPCPLVDPRLSARFVDQEIGTHLEEPFQFDLPHFNVAWAYGGDIAENESVVESVLGAALGPIDRGLRLEEGVTVTPPPASAEVLLLLGDAAVLSDSESSFFFFEGSTVDNPLDIGSATIRSYDGAGANRTLRANNTLTGTGNDTALQLSDWVEIQTPYAAVYTEVELKVVALFGATLDVVAVHADGSEGPPRSLGSGTHTVRVQDPFSMVVIRRTPGSVVQATMRRFAVRSQVTATALMTQGPPGTFVETNGLITIQGPEITSIQLSFTGPEFLLLEMALPSRAEAIVQSTQDALTELTKEDPLFEPENDYRVVVTTTRADRGTSSDSSVNAVLKNTNTFVDHGYFHIVGPPGVGTPDLPPQAQPGPTGFEDLRIYVEQTLPASIPADGGKLLLPRAFYRAYDAAVKFNEAYLELMYLRAKRDLSVRLFDGDSNAPILRADGRVAVQAPSWERSRQQTVKSSIELWIGMVNQGPCRPDNLPPFLDSSVIKPQVVSSGDAVLLAPDKLHEVRLVPVLLHETFVGALPGLVADAGGHRLERWTSDSPSGSSPRWEVQTDSQNVHFASETNGSTGSLVYAGALGAADGPDVPGNWSDFRGRVLVRWSAGVIGFEFRRVSSADLLRVTLDRGTGARQLVAMIAGQPTVLGQDTTTFPDPGTDVEIIVECVADRVRVYQDDDGIGVPALFDATGAPTAPGTVGLFVDGATTSRFTEIRLDDLRPTPSVSFAFDFVTSTFTNFFHHLHSFEDSLFDGAPGTPLSSSDLTAQMGVSIALPGAGSGSPAAGMGTVADQERRGFDTLETKSFGQAALRLPERLEVTRISASGQPLALMLRSPDPLLWDRTFVTVAATTQPLALGPSADLTLTDVTFGSAPADESVTLLVRATSNLTGYRLEWRPLPGAADPDPDWKLYFGFDSEQDLPDGTQVEILAVSAGQAPLPEPGTTQRFVGTDPSTDAVHFAAPGVELRLVAPNGTFVGTVVHQRPFLSPDAYQPFPMRAVRKLDGTAAVLFVDPSAPAPQPALTALRLQLTFTRALGDEDLRMRQGGSETPEVVTLDVPLPAPVV